MKFIYFILFLMAFSGGLSYFWRGFYETVSGWFGCMRYTYEVAIWRHCEEEVVVHNLVARDQNEAGTRSLIRLYFMQKHPEYFPFSIISITQVRKKSVMLQTFCEWLYRACTRTADDAVQDWKEQNGLAV